MKLFYLIIAFLIAGNVFGQMLRVREGNQSTSKGNQNALTIEIPHVTEDFMKEELRDYMKDWGKCKDSKSEYVVLQGEWKDYGAKTFDVYAHLQAQKDEIVSVSFSFDLGGAYLNSKDHSEQYNLFKKSIEAFGRNCAYEAVNNEVEKESKTLKSLEKEQKELEEEKSDLEKEIEDYKKKIEENQKKIEENKLSQQKKKELITTQTSKVSEVEKKKKDIY